MLAWTLNPEIAGASSTPNTWTTESSLPAARENLAAVTSSGDNRTYAIDGDTGGTTYLKTVTAYTPGSNTWAAASSDATLRTGAAAASTSDGKVYVLGGSNGS